MESTAPVADLRAGPPDGPLRPSPRAPPRDSRRQAPAHHYVANHSAGPAGLHWTVVWARYVPATEAGLVSYGYLLFHVRCLRPLYDAIADLRTWTAPAW